MQNMRGAVPVGPTGNLKRSIRKRNITRAFSNRKRISVLVIAGGPLTTRRNKSGNVYDYAVATEFGTVKERAEPFFYSSARFYQQVGRESARETVDKAIEENNRVRALRTESYSNAGVTVNIGGRGGAQFVPGSQL